MIRFSQKFFRKSLRFNWSKIGKKSRIWREFCWFGYNWNFSRERSSIPLRMQEYIRSSRRVWFHLTSLLLEEEEAVWVSWMMWVLFWGRMKAPLMWKGRFVNWGRGSMQKACPLVIFSDRFKATPPMGL